MFGDKTLVDMCAKVPRQLEDMKEIYGMGERKFAKTGKQFFAAIEDYRREHPEAELRTPDLRQYRINSGGVRRARCGRLAKAQIILCVLIEHFGNAEAVKPLVR